MLLLPLFRVVLRPSSSTDLWQCWPGLAFILRTHPCPPPSKDAASLHRAQGTADGQLGLPLDSDAVSCPASHPATKKVCLSSITHSEIAVLVQETPRASGRTRPGPHHSRATRLSPPHGPATDAAHVQLCRLYRGDLIESPLLYESPHRARPPPLPPLHPGQQCFRIHRNLPGHLAESPPSTVEAWGSETWPHLPKVTWLTCLQTPLLSLRSSPCRIPGLFTRLCCTSQLVLIR